MTLLERIQARLCAADGCRRGAAYPGQRYCSEHALTWLPEWRRRDLRRDETGRVAA